MAWVLYADAVALVKFQHKQTPKQTRLMKNLMDLVNDTSSHPDTLKLKTLQVDKKLEALKVEDTIEKYESDPNFLHMFGSNLDELLL